MLRSKGNSLVDTVIGEAKGSFLDESFSPRQFEPMLDDPQVRPTYWPRNVVSYPKS